MIGIGGSEAFRSLENIFDRLRIEFELRPFYQTRTLIIQFTILKFFPKDRGEKVLYKNLEN